jgi:hypothetical protein
VNVSELWYPNFNSGKNVGDMIQISITSTAVDYSTDHDVWNCNTWLGDESWTVQLGEIVQLYASNESSNKATENNHTVQCRILASGV